MSNHSSVKKAKNKMVYILYWLALALMLISCSDQNSAKEEQQNAVLLKDLEAAEIDSLLGSYEGKKALLVNVWATWCIPCVEEFPHIVELQEKYREDLQVIFISADFKEDRDRAADFLKKQGVNYTTYFKTGGDQKFIEALSSHWSGALPFTKMIAQNGTVINSWENSADYNTFEQNILKTINH